MANKTIVALREKLSRKESLGRPVTSRLSDLKQDGTVFINIYNIFNLIKAVNSHVSVDKRPQRDAKMMPVSFVFIFIFSLCNLRCSGKTLGFVYLISHLNRYYRLM